MALLCLLQRWNVVGLHALTVDHGLRAGSADEAAQVAQWCTRLGVAHTTLHWSGAKPARGVQAAARQARYDLMAAWCRAQGIGVVATAHTANDQAETVHMRLQRTQSPRSLAGIWPQAKWNGVAVVRPLLGLSRAALRAELLAAGQGWLNDPSNSDRRFERVRVRQALAGQPVEVLVQQATLAQAQVAQVDGAAAAWLRSTATVLPQAVLVLPLDALCRQGRDVRLAVLRRAMQLAGGGAAPDPGELARLDAWVLAGGAPRRTLSGGAPRRTLAGALVARRAGALWVVREAGRIASDTVAVPASGHVLWDGRLHLHAAAGSQVVAQGPPGGTLRVPRQAGLPRFVQAALPCLRGPGGGPWRAPAQMTLCERFEL